MTTEPRTTVNASEVEGVCQMLGVDIRDVREIVFSTKGIHVTTMRRDDRGWFVINDNELALVAHDIRIDYDGWTPGGAA